jgi:hypothetical protein
MSSGPRIEYKESTIAVEPGEQEVQAVVPPESPGGDGSVFVSLVSYRGMYIHIYIYI